MLVKILILSKNYTVVTAHSYIVDQGFSTGGPWWPIEGVHMIFLLSNTFVADQR